MLRGKNVFCQHDIVAFQLIYVSASLFRSIKMKWLLFRVFIGGYQLLRGLLNNGGHVGRHIGFLSSP